MAKTNFGPRTIVSSEFLNGAQQIHFDGADEDWHYPPINKDDIDDSFNEEFVTLKTNQTVLATKIFHDDLNVAPPNPPPGEENKYRFTGQVVGVDPSHPTHLTTKSYVDQEINNLTPPPIINLGGGVEVYDEFSSGSYVLRTLYGGNKIGLTQNDNDILIEFSANIADASVNGESLLSSTSPDILFKTIVPGNRMSSSSNTSEITFDVDDIVASDFTSGNHIAISDNADGTVLISNNFTIEDPDGTGTMGESLINSSTDGKIKKLIADGKVNITSTSNFLTLGIDPLAISEFDAGDFIDIQSSDGKIQINSTFNIEDAPLTNNTSTSLINNSTEGYLKKLIGSGKVSISSNSNYITLEGLTATSSEFISGSNIDIQDDDGKVKIASTFETSAAQTGLGSLVKDSEGTIKNLLAGDGINLAEDTNSITINSDGISSSLFTGGDFIEISDVNGKVKIDSTFEINPALSGSGSLVSSSDGKIKNIISGNGINMAYETDSITISSSVDSSIDISDFVGGNNIRIDDEAGKVEINSTFSLSPAMELGSGNPIKSSDGILKNFIGGDGILITEGGDSLTFDVDLNTSNFEEGNGISISKNGEKIKIDSTLSIENSSPLENGKLLTNSGDIRNIEGEEGLVITEETNSLKIGFDSLRLSQFHRVTEKNMTTQEFNDLFSANNFIFLDNQVTTPPSSNKPEAKGETSPYIDSTSMPLDIATEKITISDQGGTLDIIGGIHRLKNLILDHAEVQTLRIIDAIIFAEDFMVLSGLELILDNSEIIFTDSPSMLFVKSLDMDNSSIRGRFLSVIVGSTSLGNNISEDGSNSQGLRYAGGKSYIKCRYLSAIEIDGSQDATSSLNITADFIVVIGKFQVFNSEFLISGYLIHYYSNNTHPFSRIFEVYNSKIVANKILLSYFELPGSYGIVYWADSSISVRELISYNDNSTSEKIPQNGTVPVEAAAFRVINCSITQNNYVSRSLDIDESLDADAFQNADTEWIINSVNAALDIYDSYVRVKTLSLSSVRNLDSHTRGDSINIFRTTIMAESIIFELEDTGANNKQADQIAQINTSFIDAQSLSLRPINVKLTRVLKISHSRIDLNLTDSINGYQAENYILSLVNCQGRIDMPEIELACPFIIAVNCEHFELGIKWSSGDYPLLTLNRFSNQIGLDFRNTTKLGVTNVVDGRYTVAQNTLYVIAGEKDLSLFSPPTRLGIFKCPMGIRKNQKGSLGFNLGQFYNQTTLDGFGNGLDFEYYDYSSSSLTPVTNPSALSKHGEVIVL